VHDVVVVGIPLLAIFGGILFNNSSNNRLEAKLDRMQADLSQFYKDLGNHDGRIAAIERRIG
jgi:hypothetical protein